MNTISPHLSVYALVERATRDRSLITDRRTMSFISYEIENAVRLNRVRARVFAGFQRLSKFMPQVNRYRALAQHAEIVYVFGFPDITPPPMANIRYISLEPSFQLTKEWFLIADAPTYFSALATEEITQVNDPDDQRRFKGIWSFDEELVTILQQSLSELVGLAPQPEDKRDYRGQVRLMNASLARITRRLSKTASS